MDKEGKGMREKKIHTTSPSPFLVKRLILPSIGKFLFLFSFGIGNFDIYIAPVPYSP